MPGNGHVRFGRRAAETDRQKRRHRAAARPHNLVCDPTVLTLAWERVAGNTGARTAGIDRATVAWIVSRHGVETFLHEIRDQLRSRTFTPAPVRRVMIPKASGKLRSLGHPDRHRPGRAGRAETGPGTDLRG